MCKLLLLAEYICLSILERCGLIRRKVVRTERTTLIQKNRWISFILEYELIDFEINKSKLDVLIEDK